MIRAETGKKDPPPVILVGSRILIKHQTVQQTQKSEAVTVQLLSV